MHEGRGEIQVAGRVAASCRICRTPIGHNEVARGGLCGATACQHADATARARAASVERRRLEGEEVRRTAADLGSWAAETRATPAVAAAIVPAYGGKLRNASAKRQRKFRDTLTKLISEAAANPAREDAALERREVTAPTLPRTGAALGAACATCGGFCCRGGGTEAFLTAADLRGFMVAHPALRPADVLAAYLERLPNRAHVNSCVFHGRAGCALPREMRSQICERYLCDGLVDLRARLADGQPRAVLVAARTSGTVVRLNVLGADGALAPLSVEALPARLRSVQ